MEGVAGTSRDDGPSPGASTSREDGPSPGASTSREDGPPPRAGTSREDGPPPLASMASIVPGLNRFSRKLFEHLCLEEKNNLVISPIGISILLAMVADGAKGQSLAELESSLGLPESNDECNRGYKALVDELNALDNRACKFQVVNKIVKSNLFEIERKFSDDMKYYSSSILSLDWEKKDESCKAVNKFCNDKTNCENFSILSPSDVPEVPSLILLNAVYLKVMWADRFEAVCTTSEPFHVNSELEVEVPMVYNSYMFNHGKIPELDAKFVVVPFQDVRINMMVFLPNESNGMTELEKYLSTVDFSKLLETSEKQWIGLSLPTFKAENSVNLTGNLKKMGLEHVCEKEKADFSGVSDFKPLWVDGVIQKTFLDVNAAITRSRSRAGDGPDMKFKVNRPFICAIITEEYGFPIFMAKINNPTL